MKEQLITFDTAKVAKKKGFGFTLSWLNNVFDLEDEQLMRDVYVSTLNKEPNSWILAPTQSLLQKWLWEKHEIWAEAKPLYSATTFIGISVNVHSWKFPIIKVPYEGKDLYEGLELALVEAMNHIPTKNES
jgi:hypothetical protein